MRYAQYGTYEGVIVDLEYVQIRRHAKDKAVQTNLNLRRNDTNANMWTVIKFKSNFETEFVNIFDVIFYVFQLTLFRNPTI